MPPACRYVSFAGCYAEDVCRELREISPSLIVYDTFAYIGRVAAQILDLPHVNVCAGHNVSLANIDELLGVLGEHVAISPACDRWVDELRERHGLEEASPWSWIGTQSEHLNLYCEPEQYLDPAYREVFEPIAFFGSLHKDRDITPEPTGGPAFNGSGPRVYVSFGTFVWRLFPDQALAAQRVLSEALAERDGSALMSLGRRPLPEEVRRELAAPNVVLADYVDQRRVLAETDAFVTHHGLNSTHEAVWAGVPMISYPVFWDEPALAARCAEFGTAVPLAAATLEPLDKQDVHDALDRVASEAESMRSALATAREWEAQVIAERPAVVDRMLALA
jgi:UDP:flavonoid glycosyltransferase YjiC (YdhE family)